MAEPQKKAGALVSLIGGIALTLVLVIAVPVLISYFIEPVITDLIGNTEINTSIISLSSGAIGAMIMFVIMMAFMYFLGGGMILRKYGVIGIAGLFLAYWLILDDPYGALVPIIMVVILAGVSYLMDCRRRRKCVQ